VRIEERKDWITENTEKGGEHGAGKKDSTTVLLSPRAVLAARWNIRTKLKMS
jgi:hypothetical protein